MRPRAAVASDCGVVRPANEDSFFVRTGLYAVCDGMGGARAGEVASQMACLGLLALDPLHAAKEDLRRAIVSANKAIIGRSVSEDQLLGMGTTITVALVQGGTLTVAHVGDSRAYVLHEGALRQVTDDHSWVGEMVRRGEITPAQAATHPHRSVITRALGTDDDLEPDVSEVALSEGDRVLLCSDGLTGMVADEAIAELLKATAGPQEAADALVVAALAGGGEDNVTVVVIDITADGEAGDEAAKKQGGKTAADDRILLGPSDRTASIAASSHRSRRAAAAVRERLSRRVAPLARPVAAVEAEAGREATGAAAAQKPPAGSAKAPASSEALAPSEAPVSSEAPASAEAPAPSDAPISAEAPATGGEPEAAGEAAHPRRRRRWAYWLLVVVLVVAIAVGGLAWFNSTVYYVGVHEGKVALFHGMPATVLGIDLFSVHERGAVEYQSLTPYMRAQVDSHDRVSKEEGQSFLRTLSGEQ